MYYNSVLNVAIVIIFSTALNCQAQRPDELMKCTSSGEPHFVQWHATTGPAAQGITCVGNNMFKLVHNEYIEFDIKIINGYGVDVTINFLNGADIPICTARTKNFQIFHSPHCGQYDVIATLVNTSYGQTLTAKHPAANFIAIVTHINTQPRQYTIEIWQPYALVPRSRGQCSVRNCNPTRIISDTLTQPKPKQAISIETAKTICQIHLNNYQAKLRHAPSQRSAYLNGTIQRLLNDCLFDVQITGEAAAAAKSFELLMIDDLVEGAKDIHAIERMFNGASARATENFHMSTVGALIEVHNLFPRLQSNFYESFDQSNIG